VFSYSHLYVFTVAQNQYFALHAPSSEPGLISPDPAPLLAHRREVLARER
jgi:hypothetical protein